MGHMAMAEVAAFPALARAKKLFLLRKRAALQQEEDSNAKVKSPQRGEISSAKVQEPARSKAVSNCTASLIALCSDFDEQLKLINGDVMLVSTTDAILDPRTDIYSVVPVSVFSGCQRNVDGANCSTYTGDESSTFAIAEFDDTNLTSDAVSYTTNYTFTASGQYTMFGRVAMVTVDGDRIDMAIYSSVTVSVQGGSSGSYLFLYIGIAIGAVILLAGMLFCYMKKRRNEVNTKDIPFRQPVSGLERSSDYTMASSNFLSHKTPAQLQGLDMSGDYSAGNTAPSYLAVDAADSGVFDKTIRAEPGQVAESLESSESLSLNPFDRASFAGLSDDVASSRPSEMTKFSFQSGYDDDSEWEYDTRQLRGGSDFSDFSSDPGTSLPASSTFEMGRGMPILEEDDLADHSFSNDHHPSSSTNDPRSTTSSGWTVQETMQ
ncbi:hypothetical protein ON010_g2172 [Phytophthora cinnamomi]|nr:hypothetical protein ON010_g2172 [Phytophthora cinnamomi]